MAGEREQVTRASFDQQFGRDPKPMLLLEPGSLRIHCANDAAVAVYGHSRSVLEQLTVADIRPSQEMSPLITLFAAYGSDLDVINRRVWIHRLADGSNHPVHVESWPVEFERLQCRIARLHFLDGTGASTDAASDGPVLT